MEYKWILIAITLVSAIALVAAGIASTLNTYTLYYDKNVKTDMSPFIKDSFNSKFGALTLNGSKDGKIAEYTLTNTYESIINIEMTGKATLYYDGTLFDSYISKDKLGIPSNVRSGNYFILVTKDNYIDEVDTAKEVCHPDLINMTGKDICETVYTYKKVNQPIQVWEKYNTKTILSAGDYYWKFEGERYLNQVVDIVPVKKDKEFNQWTWYNSSWSNKKLLNITGGLTTLYNFTVYVQVSKVAGMMTNFSDLRIVNSTETGELYYQLDWYNSTDAGIWVFFPILTSGYNANTIYMYYNNSVATSGSQPTKSWNYKISAVWLMNSSADSLGNNNLVLDQSGYAVWDTGIFGSARNYTANTVNGNKGGDNASTDKTAWTFSTGSFSVLFWEKSPNNVAGKTYVETCNLHHDNGCYEAYRHTDGTDWELTMPAGYITGNTSNPNSNNAWHLIAQVRNGASDLQSYYDQVTDARGTKTENLNFVWPFKIGYSNRYGFNGAIDNVIIYKGYNVTFNEVKRTYQNQNLSNFIFGPEQTNFSTACSPTINTNWIISTAEVCDGVQANTGTGNITITSTGNLTLNNYANVTTNEVIINATGDRIFILNHAELRSQ